MKMSKEIEKKIDDFNTFNNKKLNETMVKRYHDLEIKKKVLIGDIKIGDKIKFNKSTNLFRRIIPSFKHKVVGHGEEYFIKGEIYEFINYWSDYTRDSGWDYDETMAMEFECLESVKKDRIGSKIVLSLRHFHEYRDVNIFEVLVGG